MYKTYSRYAGYDFFIWACGFLMLKFWQKLLDPDTFVSDCSKEHSGAMIGFFIEDNFVRVQAV
jgi:hypothetical protein